MKKIIFIFTFLLSTQTFSQVSQDSYENEDINISKLVMIYRPDPNLFYPRLSKLLWEQGVSEVGFEVQKDGKVKDVFIKKTSGYPRLDDTSLLLVKMIRFKPYQNVNEDIVSINSKISIKFILNNEDKTENLTLDKNNIKVESKNEIGVKLWDQVFIKYKSMKYDPGNRIGYKNLYQINCYQNTYSILSRKIITDSYLKKSNLFGGGGDFVDDEKIGSNDMTVKSIQPNTRIELLKNNYCS